MSATLNPPAAVAPAAGRHALVRIVAIIMLVSGVGLFVGGAVTWNLVSNQLAEEQIVVPDDASAFQGAVVDGPLTAYVEADIINHHALDATGGKTYAQMDREDPLRAVAMNASFLRASLFTSVLAFGVSALAMGLGALFFLLGLVLRKQA